MARAPLAEVERVRLAAEFERDRTSVEGRRLLAMTVRGTSCRAEASVEVADFHKSLVELGRKWPDKPVDEIVSTADRFDLGLAGERAAEQYFEDGWSVFDRLGNVAFVCDAAKIHRISRFVTLAMNAAARAPPLLLDIAEGDAELPGGGFEGTTAAYAKAMRKNADMCKGPRPRLAGTTSDNAGPQKGALVEGGPGFFGRGQTHTSGCHWVGCTPHTIPLGLKDARRLCSEIGAIYEIVAAGFEILRRRGVRDVVGLVAPLGSDSRWANLLFQVSWLILHYERAALAVAWAAIEKAIVRERFLAADELDLPSRLFTIVALRFIGCLGPWIDAITTSGRDDACLGHVLSIVARAARISRELTAELRSCRLRCSPNVAAPVLQIPSNDSVNSAL
jgi:hypothetical protein